MNPTLEIFSQGEEIVTGQIADTNAAWLSQEAVTLGFTVTRHTAVGDRLSDLTQLLHDIAGRADCCICTGGLGPTSDDLTAEAVAVAFNAPLQFDEIAFAQIQQYFINRNRVMAECNRKQAMLPKGALRLDNTVGTAPGFALSAGKCWFAFVPGVPTEMKQLYLEHIKPMLLTRFALKPSRLIIINTLGIGESNLQERLRNLPIPASVQLGFRAEVGQVQVKLLFPPDYPPEDLENLTKTMTTVIGDAVFAVEGLDGQPSADLIAVLGQLMIANRHTLAVVETVSHGLLAAKLVGVNWLQCAFYEQSVFNLAQRFHADYSPSDLYATASNIAQRVRIEAGVTLVLIQLTAEINDENHNGKTLTVLTGLFVNNEFKYTTRTLSGDSKRKQQQATFLALDLLRRHLQGKGVTA